MKNPLATRRFFVSRLGAICALCAAGPVWAQSFKKMDERWTVRVAGRSVPVKPDGSFVVPNVSVADDFGAGGAGTHPDFVSDEIYRSGRVWCGPSSGRPSHGRDLHRGLSDPSQVLKAPNADGPHSHYKHR